MISVSIIGSGNIAHHLIQAFSKAPNIVLQQVYARNTIVLEKLLTSEQICTDLTALKVVDLVIIAVSDDAVTTISNQIPFHNQLVVHTSGSVAIQNLSNHNRKGVFYPLQTFSKNKTVDFKTVPICLESENEDDYLVLQTIAATISNSVYSISSIQRKALHVAAVFTNNFVNHLYTIGFEICKEHQVPFDILKPLLVETANKITLLSPIDAQTGPAIRNDQQTIESHLAF